MKNSSRLGGAPWASSARPEPRNAERKRLVRARRDGSRERDAAVEQHAEADPRHDAHRGGGVAKIGRADRQCRAGSARARDASVARPGEAVIAGGRDHERVQPERPRDRSGGRAVLEGGERLGDPDERDPGRVERDAVQVRVDCALEPRDQLVRAPVDRPAPARLALPARDANREHRRPRRDPVHLARALRADEQPGHLSSVPLEPRRVVRARARARVAGVADQVVPAGDLAEDVRILGVDARVEQGDRHAAPAGPGQADLGTARHSRREAALLDQRRRDRGRIRDADRIDARDLGSALEEGDRPRVERRREAREDARVTVLGPHANAVLREPCDEQVVRGERGRGPAPLLRLGRLTAGRRDPIGERRAVQDDDHPLAHGDLLARAAHEATPRRGRESLLLVPGSSGSGADGQERRGQREGREQAELRGFTPP